MFKVLIFLAAAFILYKLFTGDRKKKADLKATQTAKMADEGLLVKDPVCGTFVSKDSQIRVKDGDQVRCFCSFECREKYIKMLESAK